MTFTQQDGGFLIEDKFLFAASTASMDAINLAIKQAEDMPYDKHPYTLINYPGEYDLDGIFIRVFADADKKLHYLITRGNMHLAIVQSPKALEFESMDEATIFYYTDDKVADKIDKMELSGDKIKLVTTDIS